MKQLYFVKKGKLEWRETRSPKISTETDALVRPFAVAKCDLDDAFLFNNVALKIRIGRILGVIDPSYQSVFGNLMNGPFPFGHECVAQVIDVGDQVKGLRVGDTVSVPFQISCGFCDHCMNGLTATCSSVEPISTYGFGKHLGFGGAMSDMIRVPHADHMLVKIPEHIDPIALASLSDNIPDAYRHVETLTDNPDKSVLILGGKAKSVGIYALILARAIGAKEVDFVDNNPERIQLAEKLEASHMYTSFSQLHKKYDLVIDASSTPKGLQAAFRSVKNYGTVSSSGIYIRKPALSLIEWYAKGVTFKIGMANARTEMTKVLELIKAQTIDFGVATTRMDQWENAIDAFLTDTTKVVVKREKLKVT